jgi:hypothetical protein
VPYRRFGSGAIFVSAAAAVGMWAGSASRTLRSGTKHAYEGTLGVRDPSVHQSGRILREDAHVADIATNCAAATEPAKSQPLHLSPRPPLPLVAGNGCSQESSCRCLNHLTLSALVRRGARLRIVRRVTHFSWKTDCFGIAVTIGHNTLIPNPASPR